MNIEIKPTPLTLRELFNANDQYIIPIYQRNYAWGASEIEQLLQDIYDSAFSNNDKKHQYFLGSLVVYQRPSQANHSKVFETIDGQQRHTTLSILLACLKNYLESTEQYRYVTEELHLNELTLNLTFDSRPKSVQALQKLDLGEASSGIEEPNIRAAYDIIARYFKLNKTWDFAMFSRYLLNDVQILRVPVPQGTDLNHYFEIMNNRGEQLEKHEVLKAELMALYKDAKDRDCFAAIWDACADMKRYTQLGFNPKVRTAIFGETWRSFPKSFNDIKAAFANESSQSSDAITLKEIIKNRKTMQFDSSAAFESAKSERFESIIDFSNFLLHVLKVTARPNVSLDDKKLLVAFSKQEQFPPIDPSKFVFNLLKYRCLFDRYIIKRDNSESWSLLTLAKYDSSFSYVASFGDDDATGMNKRLLMLQAMFHVSNPSMVYKRWLNSALARLGEIATPTDLSVNADNYLAALETLSDEYLKDICGSANSFNVDVLNSGTAVPNFIFNRLDYLLWLKSESGESIGDITGVELKEHFKDFQFSLGRTSVEHYFPQTDPSGKPAKELGMENVDRFGNLCLISPSSNSRLCNYSPADKKSFYRQNKRAESLKQTLMMNYSAWGPDENGLKNINHHEQEMLNVLCKQATTIDDGV